MYVQIVCQGWTFNDHFIYRSGYIQELLYDTVLYIFHLSARCLTDLVALYYIFFLECVKLSVP